ncbi:MAG: PDZ domain-containing protein [Planctomycetes bacterium]|nr:PDZ domain-containing protein [Planctomycetota bacterium]MBL7009482.1 PDZ domain-containing protein [Planctomycetota bacterium]
MRRSPFLSCLSLLLGASALPAQGSGPVEPHAGMLRWPDVSETRIVFSYANDLWTVSRSGGVATPLASPPGQESFPRFSPDGDSIAFIGNYEGNADIYTVPVGGGAARRLTHHPAGEILNDWLPDGRLLFHANGFAGLGRQSTLMTVSAAGGLPEALPVPYGAFGAISPDGRWLAYTPLNRDGRTWKRYRGGHASDIWLFHLQDHSARKLTDWEGTDSQPMWHDGALYYLSDAGPEHRLNIWRYDLKDHQRAQLTRFTDHDIAWPAMGPGHKGQGEIVFQVGAELRLLDLGNRQSRAVKVEIPGDATYLRTKTADAARNIMSWSLSPSGKRAAVSARGDVWTLPAEHGSPRNLTRSDGSAERGAAWSPDGRWIAYFSDATGEYELWMTQSDGKGETRQLTSDGGPFKTDLQWSPDSEHLLFRDKTGDAYLHQVAGGETKRLAESDWEFWGGGMSTPSWSHDSRWITWSKAVGDAIVPRVHLYEVESGVTHVVTSGRFPDQGPVFDRKGDWLFFASDRHFSPTYSSLDTSFVYQGSSQLMAVPLRADVAMPWAPASDEEEWDEEPAEDEADDAGAAASDDGDDDGGDQEPAVDDGLSGTWEGTLSGDMIPGGSVPMSITVEMDSKGGLGGSVVTPMGTAAIMSGSFDRASGLLELILETDDGMEVTVRGTVAGDTMTGTGSIPAAGMDFECELKRTSKGGGGAAAGGGGASAKAREVVEIDLDGFERRAVELQVSPGNFGQLAVNDKNHLLYVRAPVGGDGSPSIMLVDLEDEKQAEKTVAAGAGGFDISADGKKLLVVRGRSASIQDAAAGATGKNVPTGGMRVTIDPRAEWAQLYTDAWRIMRDYFYAPNMHGVDWQAVHDQYAAMLPFCASREDLQYVLGEVISELNVGHAYLAGPGDGERGPSENVGMLGVDWELADGAYRIARIHHGGDWDSDARGPLSQPGVDVKEGDYLLAVNRVPVDPARDPWAAFVGLAGSTVTLTVSDKPLLDDEAREVVVKPLGSEMGLRYRSWVEANRRYVEEQTGGRVGYIYVPDTGVQGQNELVRQFAGSFTKPALIIDERWNGGGQIPTRFIELLNRPVTNYWTTRDGRDFRWPPDSHQGPKCMLINGPAGSGGDAFPAYFKQAGLGKLIGRRTWGGLIGISGNPMLIDGGGVTVPTFGYYEKDGTWGIEGHGVEPDIDVVDDPSLMTEGGDPQLDAAIAHILEELELHPYAPPQRPAHPDRSGMGVLEEDR